MDNCGVRYNFFPGWRKTHRFLCEKKLVLSLKHVHNLFLLVPNLYQDAFIFYDVGKIEMSEKLISVHCFILTMVTVNVSIFYDCCRKVHLQK